MMWYACMCYIFWSNNTDEIFIIMGTTFTWYFTNETHCFWPLKLSPYWLIHIAGTPTFLSVNQLLCFLFSSELFCIKIILFYETIKFHFFKLQFLTFCNVDNEHSFFSFLGIWTHSRRWNKSGNWTCGEQSTVWQGGRLPHSADHTMPGSVRCYGAEGGCGEGLLSQENFLSLCFELRKWESLQSTPFRYFLELLELPGSTISLSLPVSSWAWLQLIWPSSNFLPGLCVHLCGGKHS